MSNQTYTEDSERRYSVADYEAHELQDESPAMSMLASIYEDSKAGGWVRDSPEECGCNGSGWFSSPVDTWHHCRNHQPECTEWCCHPESDEDICLKNWHGPIYVAPSPVFDFDSGEIPF